MEGGFVRGAQDVQPLAVPDRRRGDRLDSGRVLIVLVHKPYRQLLVRDLNRCSEYAPVLDVELARDIDRKRLLDVLALVINI